MPRRKHQVLHFTVAVLLARAKFVLLSMDIAHFSQAIGAGGVGGANVISCELVPVRNRVGLLVRDGKDYLWELRELPYLRLI